MDNIQRLKSRFVELYALTRLQRGTRLLLRAFWLGVSGVLLAWGANALWGWLPNPASWVMVGLGFAIIPTIAIWTALFPVLFSLAPHKQWVWWADKRLGMREQFSTAWEVVERRESGPVSDLLVQEVLAGMPDARQRVLRDGWYRKADLFASLLATLAGCFLLAALLFQPDPGSRGQEPGGAPPAALPQEQQPAPGGESGNTEQPGGAPGDEGQGGEGEGEEAPGPGDAAGQDAGAGGEGQGDSAGEPGGGDSAGEQGAESQDGAPGADSQGLADALREMGEALSRQAGTHELGQALENLDMNQSAEALEDLSQRLNELSPESRENMAQAMQDAASDTQQAGDPDLSENLSSAAEALSAQEQSAGQALGEVADDLRQRAGQMQPAGNGSQGAGQGESAESGSPEPLQRLQNDGGRFDLPLDPSSESHLLSPAPPDAQGEGTVGGAYDSTNQPGQAAEQSPLLPNSLLWKWRDVVSEYFQR